MSELAQDRALAHQYAVRILAATQLRDAVSMFNASVIHPAAIDELRERVLLIADTLCPPPGLIDMSAASDAELGARVGLKVIHGGDDVARSGGAS